MTRKVQNMKKVVVESPLSGDFERNVRYAKLCMLDCLVNHKEAPYASHLLYTQCLDDDVHEQRRLGMEAGFVWGLAAEKCVVYTDLGESRGMKEGVAKATENGQVVEFRQLPSELLKRLDDSDDDLGATEGFKGCSAKVRDKV
jgi:hypothetical protein